MEYSFRLFAPNDLTKLDHIRQIWVTGIVTSLSHIKYGEKSSDSAIKKRKKTILLE